MKKNLFFALAFLLVCTFGAMAQDSSVPYIEVTGKAEKEIAPDKIYLAITINEGDYKNKTMSLVEREMMQSLKAIGIDTKKDLSVTDMASNFKNYFLKKKDVKLSKDYQLVVGDAKTAGTVIIELQKIGISNLNITKLENTKLEQYKQEVKVAAIQAAKAKAILLTEAIGQSIGKAIYIYEQENYYRNAYPAAGYNLRVKNTMDMMESVAEEAPDIEFENMKIESTITVRFQLE